MKLKIDSLSKKLASVNNELATNKETLQKERDQSEERAKQLSRHNRH